MICDFYIHKTDLAGLSSFNKFLVIFAAISKYLLPLELGNLLPEQTKFPVFWQNFQIPCVFPDRDYFWPFSLFSLCSGTLFLHCHRTNRAVGGIVEAASDWSVCFLALYQNGRF